MFTTTIKISKPDTRASSFEAFSALYCEIIGEDCEDELNYIRSDCIIDGIMKEETFKGWDNDSKTMTLIHYHETSENMRDYQLALTENALSVEAQKRLHDAGWTISVEPGTAENTAQANKLHVIDEWAIDNVRPDRRAAVMENIIKSTEL